MHQLRITTITCAFLAVVAASAVAGEGKAAGKRKLRIGVYDNRAIAVAYVASRFNPVGKKMAEYKRAKAAGDRKKMQELESWGKRLQRKLHFQGFGHVPVGDLLQPVKKQVAELAKQKRLVAIARNCDFHTADVEIVDVTMDLVKLYRPSEKTLQRAKSIRNAKPIGLTVIADLPVDK